MGLTHTVTELLKKYRPSDISTRLMASVTALALLAPGCSLPTPKHSFLKIQPSIESYGHQQDTSKSTKEVSLLESYFKESQSISPVVNSSTQKTSSPSTSQMISDSVIDLASLQPPNFSDNNQGNIPIKDIFYNLEAFEKKDSQNKLQDIGQIIGAIYLGNKISTVNHELNGHGLVHDELGAKYDVAIKLGPFGISSGGLELPTGAAGIVVAKEMLPLKQHKSAVLGGFWASQNLYQQLTSYLKRNDTGDSSLSNKIAHSTAFLTGSDLTRYYLFHLGEGDNPSPWNDVNFLIENGHKTDVEYAVAAQIIGEGRNLYWHFTKALGMETSKPEPFTFRIPGTSLRFEFTPTAYIDPFNNAIGPGIRGTITYDK